MWTYVEAMGNGGGSSWQVPWGNPLSKVII